MIRLLVRRCIEANTKLEVCGEAENGRIAVEMVIKFKPQIVVMDFQMPVMDGLQAARQIKQISPDTSVLLLTMHNSEQVRSAAKAVGISGVLSKSECVAERLLDSIRQVVPSA